VQKHSIVTILPKGKQTLINKKLNLPWDYSNMFPLKMYHGIFMAQKKTQ